MAASLYTVVIPVFNGATIIARTIDRVAWYFRTRGLAFELIVVNDGSSDDTWDVLKREVGQRSNLVAVNLVKNYGQHAATQCGLHVATGDYVITMDDDLQHDPIDIDKLIAKAALGHDVVFGQFERARRAWYRRPETVLVTALARLVFGMPSDIKISSFRLLRRDVVNRMLALESSTPYVTGLALAAAKNPGNADVCTREGIRQSSSYSLGGLVRLATAVLLSTGVARQGSTSHRIGEVVRSASTRKPSRSA
jgi:glycosyltransferase involved in cell wall biosynthesis